MDKGVGKALESALKEKEAPVATPKTKGKYIFSNQNRRAIFSTLTLSPCIGIVDIAKRTQISENSVNWHVKNLISSGYVVERRVGKRRIFFPEGLVPSEEARFFYTFNRPSIESMLSLVFRYPGSTQREISKISNIRHQKIAKAMKELESEGLVSRVSEGNHVRYYPTNLLSIKSENFYANSKRFTDFLFKKIDANGENPKIIKKSVDRIILELGPKNGRYVMEIGINPYITR